MVFVECGGGKFRPNRGNNTATLTHTHAHSPLTLFLCGWLATHKMLFSYPDLIAYLVAAIVREDEHEVKKQAAYDPSCPSHLLR